MAVVLALAGICLAPVSADAAPDSPPVFPPPAPGVTPGLVVTPKPEADVFYTAADGVVWIVLGTIYGGPPELYGGRIVSAPAPIYAAGTDVVFGQGTGAPTGPSGSAYTAARRGVPGALSAAMCSQGPGLRPRISPAASTFTSQSSAPTGRCT